jgi:Protein of unknown function DUF262
MILVNGLTCKSIYNDCNLTEKGKVMEWFKERYTAEVSISEILDCIVNKKLRLPLYQRDAIWSEGRICTLWDSLLRGFPLPSFLLVKGDSGRAFAGDNVRGRVISDDTEAYYNVLDGQQRLGAIIAGAGKDSGIRLWVDLAPPQTNHPLRYNYWLHPCTRAFPFGFRMEASGEYDFHPLHDSAFQDIWACMQGIKEFKNKEFYEILPDSTFPWAAGCPVPLADLLLLNTSLENVQDRIYGLIETQNKTSNPFGRQLNAPNSLVCGRVIAGLKRIQKAKLTLQYIDLNNLEEGEGGGYELFERIGRGGVQISPRQLAVSKLMLVLGNVGNDALVSFQESEYGCLLETEDVVHALARVALTEVKDASNVDGDKQDLSDLSIERLQSLKKNANVWTSFTDQLRTYCNPHAVDHKQTNLGFAFDRVFQILKFDPQSNPNGLPLVQLAQFSRKREGVEPITLHPLLLWQMKYSKQHPPDNAHRDEMLRWILFANGFTHSPQNSVLNREMFEQVNTTCHLSFTEILAKVFKDNGQNKLLQDLGFQLSVPTLRNGKVEDVISDRKTLPTPSEVITLTASRLILRNWVYSGINNFILMWNQRAGLHEMYGAVKARYIPALFGKGRPFDADHIVARSRLLYIALGDEILKQGCRFFFKDKSHAEVYFVKDWCFRKQLPNITANYRYWPKRLNRANGNDIVRDKMPIQSILAFLHDHPLFNCFDEASSDNNISWSWSAIPQENITIWNELPPPNYVWSAELVEQFIMVLLQREYFLYSNAYNFLTGEKNEKFKCDGII